MMNSQKNQKSQSVQFSTRAEDYDRLQPIRIEMFEFYHSLAMDFIPFGDQTEFRMLDLGCGTGIFLNCVLMKYPKATCVAIDFSDEMMKFAAQKVSTFSDRVEFFQRDLNEGLLEGLGSFQFVASFSTIHHLTDENKVRIFRQIYDVLETGGWFFFIDAMSTRFDDDVYRLGRRRLTLRREERFEEAGIDIEEANRVREIIEQVDEDSPERDRISRFSSQVEWLKEAGFRSVDYIWHLWMEHFIICRK